MLGGLLPAAIGVLFVFLTMVVGLALSFGIVIATEYLQKKFSKK